jgi:hypothetical protein
MIKAEIKNFTKKELACRCGCGLLDYDDNFLVRLQAFRLILSEPLYPTSGCRCKRHNAYVGGVPNSLHEAETKPATAVDVANSNVKHVYETAINSRLFNEVILYKRKAFVHLGYNPNQSGNYFKIKE